jgi:hypothetical protein
MPPYQNPIVATLALKPQKKEKSWLAKAPLEGFGVSADDVCSFCLYGTGCDSSAAAINLV